MAFMSDNAASTMRSAGGKDRGLRPAETAEAVVAVLWGLTALRTGDFFAGLRADERGLFMRASITS